MENRMITSPRIDFLRSMKVLRINRPPIDKSKPSTIRPRETSTLQERRRIEIKELTLDEAVKKLRERKEVSKPFERFYYTNRNVFHQTYGELRSKTGLDAFGFCRKINYGLEILSAFNPNLSLPEFSLAIRAFLREAEFQEGKAPLLKSSQDMDRKAPPRIFQSAESILGHAEFERFVKELHNILRSYLEQIERIDREAENRRKDRALAAKKRAKRMLEEELQKKEEKRVNEARRRMKKIQVKIDGVKALLAFVKIISDQTTTNEAEADIRHKLQSLEIKLTETRREATPRFQLMLQ